MDELWQRFRTFWTPVLIGLGVFLVGVIAVHIISSDPDQAEGRMRQNAMRLKKMKAPDTRKAAILRERGESLAKDIGAWGARLNQAPGAATEVVAEAAAQALRAAILRGAEDEEAAQSRLFKVRFDDDPDAADKAWRQFRKLVTRHRELLRTGDPNVAFSQLLSDVWTALRVRANRADVELNAEQLGFATVGSVSRATLQGRVLNLALVARMVDTAIRNDMQSVESVQIPTNIDAAGADDFLVLWPVDVVMIGDMNAVKHVVDLLTDPQNPVPLEATRLAQPKRGGRLGSGLVELSVRASSVIVRPTVDLKLDAEEDE